MSRNVVLCLFASAFTFSVYSQTSSAPVVPSPREVLQGYCDITSTKKNLLVANIRSCVSGILAQSNSRATSSNGKPFHVLLIKGFGDATTVKYFDAASVKSLAFPPRTLVSVDPLTPLSLEELNKGSVADKNFQGMQDDNENGGSASASETISKSSDRSALGMAKSLAATSLGRLGGRESAPRPDSVEFAVSEIGNLDYFLKNSASTFPAGAEVQITAACKSLKANLDKITENRPPDSSPFVGLLYDLKDALNHFPPKRPDDSATSGGASPSKSQPPPKGSPKPVSSSATP